MPQFQIRVFTQCAVPGMTPDQDNGLTQMPKRVLYEPPAFMEHLLRAAKTAVNAADELEAARAVVPTGYQLALLPGPYQHRESQGTYVQSAAGGELVFVLGSTAGGALAPFATTQTHSFRVMNASGETQKTVQVEFRCHLMVKAL